jgi:Zn-dependent peptidase ImmA (M78 family)
VHVDKDFPVLMRDAISSQATNSIEIQANQFAAELLMPAELLEKALAEIRFDIDDEKPIEALAKKVKVSKQALEYRIRNLPSKK